MRFSSWFHGRHHKWWALVTVALGTFMATLDASIVNVSLPAILQDFHTDLPTIEWVILAYLLAITALLLTFGRLADIWGRKKVYTLGFAIFTTGSLLCGLAGSPRQLILARVFQAIGAAMLQANGLAITGAVFPREERGRALGINGAVVATGFTIGPTIGGILVSAFSWRAIFLVNLPIGLVGIALALLILEERRISFQAGGDAARRFDLAGAVVVSVALVTLLLGLNQGQDRGWGSPFILGLLATAVVSFALFLAIERRVAAPLISLALFRIRGFSIGSLAALLSFLALSANGFLMPFFLQLILGYDPARAGLLLTPTSLAQAVVAPVSGWLSDRFGARLLSSVGLAITSVALFLLGQLTAGAHYASVIAYLVLLGLGSGIFNSPNTSEVLGSIPRERYGVAAGFLSMVRNSGQVIGVALAGALLLSQFAPGPGHAGLGTLGTSAPGALAGPLRAAFLAGFQRAYLVAALLALSGVVASVARGRRTRGAPASQTVEMARPRDGEAAQPAGRFLGE